MRIWICQEIFQYYSVIFLLYRCNAGTLKNISLLGMPRWFGSAPRSSNLANSLFCLVLLPPPHLMKSPARVWWFPLLSLAAGKTDRWLGLQLPTGMVWMKAGMMNSTFIILAWQYTVLLFASCSCQYTVLIH